MQKLTNEKKSINTDYKIIDTNEKISQTSFKKNELISLNTGLAIIKPKFIKKFKHNNKLRLAIVYTISLLIVAFSFIQIYRLHSQKSETLELTSKLKGYITEIEFTNSDSQGETNNKYSVDFDSLKEINSDTIGWIKVNGIEIDFPVVQTTDNSYYLKHSFEKKYNVCGWIFADYRNKFDNTDKNIIIYGHNRRDGTMFSNIANILKSDWYDNDENKYITFINQNGEVRYEVFSIYQIKVEDYYIKTEFATDEEYLDFLNKIKSRSIKDYNIELTAKDQILTLSTCGKEKKYRVVLHAKKI